MAVLGESNERWTKHLIDTVDALVTTAEDVWIASPFLNTVALTPAHPERLARLILAESNENGTWGDGAALAYLTAADASALLLLGVELANADTVGDLLLAEQSPTGGWALDTRNPTLEASYHVAAAHAQHIVDTTYMQSVICCPWQTPSRFWPTRPADAWLRHCARASAR